MSLLYWFSLDSYYINKSYIDEIMKPLKMYICIKKSIPSHKAIGIAHGVLMAHLKFSKCAFCEDGKVDSGGFTSWDSPIYLPCQVCKGNGKNLDYENWLLNSFRKVVVEVSDEEFEQIKQFENGIIVTESGLDGMEIAQVFCPRPEWPKIFKTFPFLNL